MICLLFFLAKIQWQMLPRSLSLFLHGEHSSPWHFSWTSAHCGMPACYGRRLHMHWTWYVYFHRSAAAALTNQVDIGEMLSKQYATEKRANREYLLKILSSIRFVARQGLPLRGDMNETDSNFYQLLMLWGKESDGPGLKAFLDKKQLKYTFHKIQNEMLATMALQVLHHVAKNLQSSAFFALWSMKPLMQATPNKSYLYFDGSTITWLSMRSSLDFIKATLSMPNLWWQTSEILHFVWILRLKTVVDNAMMKQVVWVVPKAVWLS